MQTFRILASVSLLLACTPKQADTDGDSSSGAQTDGASVTSATGNPTTGAATTTGATTTTGADPTNAQTASSAPDNTSTTSTTTGPSDTTSDTDDVDLPEACAAVCAHWDECSPGIVGPVAECTASCIEDVGDPGECVAAIDAQWSCVAGLSCEEALKFIESTPTSCLREVQATDDACMGLACNGEVGGGDDSCEFQQQCNGVDQAIVCNAEVCTCTDDGVPGKECPMDGLCLMDGKGLYEAVNACCGFEWK